MKNSEKVKQSWLKRMETYPYAVPLEQFKTVTTKEVAYILGLLWADGNIYMNSKCNNISIECVAEDVETFAPLFFTTGKWNQYFRTRKNRRPSSTLRTQNKPLCLYLASLDFDAKSVESHKKVIESIPANLFPYWLLGLFDGDGTFANDCKSIEFSGPYEQDWSFLKTTLERFEIKSKHYKYINKNNPKYSHSSFRIHDKASVRNFIKLVYADKNFCSLRRKKEKIERLLD